MFFVAVLNQYIKNTSTANSIVKSQGQRLPVNHIEGQHCWLPGWGVKDISVKVRYKSNIIYDSRKKTLSIKN
jgi:hypothetical protein